MKKDKQIPKFREEKIKKEDKQNKYGFAIKKRLLNKYTQSRGVNELSLADSRVLKHEVVKW